MKPLRIAVLGAGLIGRKHIKTILSMPQLAELVAVADPAADPGQFEFEQTLWFADARDMLDCAQPEAVVIATPNGLHTGHGQMCCARGIHFLIEKPVTATLDEAAALVEAVQRSEVKTLVGHHRRYLSVVQEARRLIGEGKLGALIAASVVWATRKPDDYFQMQWRTQAGGGPLLINAIHEIDMLRYLCGEIVSVGGITSHAVRGFAVEDSAVAMFQFDSGCLGTLTCSDAGFSPWTSEQGTHENPNFAYSGQSSYRLIGSKGSLELPVLRTWTARTQEEVRWDRPIVSGEPVCEYRDPYQAQLIHFQRLIRLDEAPVIPVIEGARTLAATLAVAQSSAQGSRYCPRVF